jgi:hypothetical protein
LCRNQEPIPSSISVAHKRGEGHLISLYLSFSYSCAGTKTHTEFYVSLLLFIFQVCLYSYFFLHTWMSLLIFIARTYTFQYKYYSLSRLRGSLNPIGT